MTAPLPDDVRAAIREADKDLETVRREMDAYVDLHGAMPGPVAREFAARLESAVTRAWELRSKLRTPRPPF